jgi:lipoprotein LprG
MWRALTLIVLSWLLVACGAQSSQPKPSADEIKARAAATMSALTSLHFTIELSGKLTYIDTSRLLALKRAEGDIVAPDRVKAVVRTRTFGTTTEIGIVGIADQQWARNPVSGRWETLPPSYGTFDIAALFAPEHGLGSLLKTQSLAQQPNDTLDGRAHYLLGTTVPGAVLAPMTSGMITTGTVQAQLWVDSTTFTLSQIALTESDTDPDDPTHWLIKLSAFNQPVEITPPSNQ